MSYMILQIVALIYGILPLSQKWDHNFGLPRRDVKGSYLGTLTVLSGQQLMSTAVSKSGLSFLVYAELHLSL